MLTNDKINNKISKFFQTCHKILINNMSELTPDTVYPEVAKERRSSSFSDAHLEKVL